MGTQRRERPGSDLSPVTLVVGGLALIAAGVLVVAATGRPVAAGVRDAVGVGVGLGALVGLAGFLVSGYGAVRAAERTELD